MSDLSRHEANRPFAAGASRLRSALQRQTLPRRAATQLLAAIIEPPATVWRSRATMPKAADFRASALRMSIRRGSTICSHGAIRPGARPSRRVRTRIATHWICGCRTAKPAGLAELVASNALQDRRQFIPISNSTPACVDLTPQVASSVADKADRDGKSSRRVPTPRTRPTSSQRPRSAAASSSRRS